MTFDFTSRNGHAGGLLFSIGNGTGFRLKMVI
jgi:hypothetical protein